MMFYEIFFGIVLGVIVAVIATVAILRFLYWESDGKANYERMKAHHEKQMERVEKYFEE